MGLENRLLRKLEVFELYDNMVTRIKRVCFLGNVVLFGLGSPALKEFEQPYSRTARWSLNKDIEAKFRMD